jgi:hypothetical protein
MTDDTRCRKYIVRFKTREDYEKYLGRKARRMPPVEKLCCFCGNAYYVRPAHASITKYCSDECYLSNRNILESVYKSRKRKKERDTEITFAGNG